MWPHQAWMDPAACESETWSSRTWVSVFILGCSSSIHLCPLCFVYAFELPPLSLPFPDVQFITTSHGPQFILLPISLFYIQPRPQLYTRDRCFFSFHSLPSSLPLTTTVLLGGSENRTRHPKSLFIKVILYQTVRQMRGGVTLQPKPFMIGQSAKWLTVA